MMNPIASLMGPDVTQQQYQLQQNQRYADILMQQALQEQPQGQMVSGHYVPPSPVQGLAQLLKAYVGRRASDLLPEQQSKLDTAKDEQLQRMVGLGGGSTTPTQARDVALGGGAMQGDVGPTVGNATRMDNVQQGRGSAIPLLNNDPRSTYFALRFGGPQAYAKALVDQGAPSSELKALIAAGYQPGSPQFQQAAMRLVNKNEYIAPTVAGEGSTLFKPGSNIPFYVTSKDGMQPSIGPNGRISTSIIPGYLEGTGQIKQTQAYNQGLGQAQTTKDQKVDLTTGNIVGTTAADVMGLPRQGSGANNQQSSAPVVTQINPVVTKAGEQLNNQWITGQFEPAIAAGEAAKGAMENVRLLKSIDLTTGFGTDAQKTAANVLASFGVKDAAKFATNAQIFESKIYEGLVDTLAKQKGPQTDKDFANLQKTYASLKNTSQANQFLLDVVEAKAMQDQRKAGYFQKAASIPELRSNLSAITNEWGKVSGSMFDLPIQGKDGSTYTLAQRYGIK